MSLDLFKKQARDEIDRKEAEAKEIQASRRAIELGYVEGYRLSAAERQKKHDEELEEAIAPRRDELRQMYGEKIGDQINPLGSYCIFSLEGGRRSFAFTSWDKLKAAERKIDNAGWRKDSLGDHLNNVTGRDLLKWGPDSILAINPTDDEIYALAKKHLRR